MNQLDRCQKGGCVCPSLAKAKYCGAHVIDALGECPIKGCDRKPESDRFVLCDVCAGYYERWVRGNLDNPSCLLWLQQGEN